MGAQSEGGGGQPPAPEIENPNTDSYAAYQSKDPFRQLFRTSESTTQREDSGRDAREGDDTDGSRSDGSRSDGSRSDGSAEGGFEDTDDKPSVGDRGAADDQYENVRRPRQDPIGAGDSGGARAKTPAPQTPAPRTQPADPGDGLFDSGGNLDDPFK